MSEELMNESGDTTKSLIFKRDEPVKAFLLDHEPLYLKHCAEVGYFKDFPPEMIWRDYLALEAAGFLRIFTVRNLANDLVGYALYFVRQNLHYAKSKIAMCDMIYILPEYRGGTGEEFIDWIDQNLKSEGVNAVSHHAKVYYDFGSMLDRLEYKHVENIYIRRLN